MKFCAGICYVIFQEVKFRGNKSKNIFAGSGAYAPWFKVIGRVCVSQTQIEKKSYPIADCPLGLKNPKQIANIICDSHLCRTLYCETQIFAVCYRSAQM
jgi:hypothetical protein